MKKLCQFEVCYFGLVEIIFSSFHLHLFDEITNTKYIKKENNIDKFIFFGPCCYFHKILSQMFPIVYDALLSSSSYIQYRSFTYISIKSAAISLSLMQI